VSANCSCLFPLISVFFFFWDILLTLLGFVGFWIELMFSSTLVNVTLKVR
jgi:hypothetical protein